MANPIFNPNDLPIDTYGIYSYDPDIAKKK